MRLRITCAWTVLAALLATPVAAEPLPTAGRYRCVIIGMGACSDRDGEQVCTGLGVARAHRRAILQLDFTRNEADLNGLRGAILRDGEGGGTAGIVWGDLNLLGVQSIRVRRMERRMNVDLRRDEIVAEFRCRPA